MKKWLYVFVTLTLVLLMAGCEKEPIKIGFIGDISTKNSQLAIDARNAVDLYISQVNEAGGIHGRQLSLVVKDDQADLSVAANKHRQFKDEDVHFVIGHMNSNMSEPMINSANEELLFFSPSMSTTVLTGIDDYIIRSSPVNDRQADLFYEYALNQNIQDLLIVYDMMNAVYTKTVADRIVEKYGQSDLRIAGQVEYDTRRDELDDVADEIKQYEFKNILVISQATDSAYLIQDIKRENQDIKTFSVSWSMTNDFIQNGGKAVNGTVFIGIYMPEVNPERYNEFVVNFEDKFGYRPSFVSVLGYDAIKSLCVGLEEASHLTPESVKEAIIDIGEFEGLQESFTIDSFGDNNRKYMMYRLEDAEFIPIRQWD